MRGLIHLDFRNISPLSSFLFIYLLSVPLPQNAIGEGLADAQEVACFDRDLDGFPDVAEFKSEAERRNFLRWFTLIASHAASHGVPNVHSCSEFVIYCYREALKRHDLFWRKKHGIPIPNDLKDMRSFYYPNVPLLGTKIFRTSPNPLRCKIEDEFAVSATAEALIRYNLVRVCRNVRCASNGDLLAFYHPESRMPYHLMIMVKRTDGWYLAYHTGPDDESEGIFKFIKIKWLLEHPDPTWRPVPSNRCFLGVFRWKVVE